MVAFTIAFPIACQVMVSVFLRKRDFVYKVIQHLFKTLILVATLYNSLIVLFK